MWASTYGASGYGDTYGGGSGGAAVASAQQWPPGALNGMQWWHAQDAHAGWYYQAHGQAAAPARGSAVRQQEKIHQAAAAKWERGASSDQPVRSGKAQAVSATKAAAKALMSSGPTGLSFFELEQRLTQSWEDLENKKPPCNAEEPPSSTTQPQTLKDFSAPAPTIAKAAAVREAEAERSTIDFASIFCPICADSGSTCPFHATACWQSFEDSVICQQLACEAPPPSHIAHAMVDLLLDAEVDLLLDAEDSSLRHLQEKAPGVVWPAAASSAPKVAQTNAEALRQITAMGFAEADAQSALAHTGQRGVDAAIAFLIDESCS